MGELAIEILRPIAKAVGLVAAATIILLFILVVAIYVVPNIRSILR